MEEIERNAKKKRMKKLETTITVMTKLGFPNF